MDSFVADVHLALGSPRNKTVLAPSLTETIRRPGQFERPMGSPPSPSSESGASERSSDGSTTSIFDFHQSPGGTLLPPPEVEPTFKQCRRRASRVQRGDCSPSPSPNREVDEHEFERLMLSESGNAPLFASDFTMDGVDSAPAPLVVSSGCVQPEPVSPTTRSHRHSAASSVNETSWKRVWNARRASISSSVAAVPSPCVSPVRTKRAHPQISPANENTHANVESFDKRPRRDSEDSDDSKSSIRTRGSRSSSCSARSIKALSLAKISETEPVSQTMTSASSEEGKSEIAKNDTSLPTVSGPSQLQQRRRLTISSKLPPLQLELARPALSLLAVEDANNGAPITPVTQVHGAPLAPPPINVNASTENQARLQAVWRRQSLADPHAQWNLDSPALEGTFGNVGAGLASATGFHTPGLDGAIRIPMPIPGASTGGADASAAFMMTVFTNQALGERMEDFDLPQRRRPTIESSFSRAPVQAAAGDTTPSTMQSFASQQCRF